MISRSEGTTAFSARPAFLECAAVDPYRVSEVARTYSCFDDSQLLGSGSVDLFAVAKAIASFHTLTCSMSTLTGTRASELSELPTKTRASQRSQARVNSTWPSCKASHHERLRPRKHGTVPVTGQ